MPIDNEVSKTIEPRPGYRLAYKLIEIDKHQPVIILLHGLASNHTRWSEFVTHTELKQHFNILRVDLMGHGLSMQRRRVTRQQWAVDLQLILRAEGFQQTIIIGHSLGAQVAMEFAHLYPQATKAIVLIDPTFPHQLRGSLLWFRRFKYVLWLVMWLTFGLNKLGVKKHHIPLRDLWELDKQTRIKLAQQQDIATLYMNPFADLEFIPFANYLQDVYELYRRLPALEEIRAPVLALVSSGTELSDRKGNEKQIKRFPHGEICYIEADHWPLTENPQQTRSIIEMWCEKFTLTF